MVSKSEFGNVWGRYFLSPRLMQQRFEREGDGDSALVDPNRDIPQNVLFDTKLAKYIGKNRLAKERERHLKYFGMSAQPKPVAFRRKKNKGQKSFKHSDDDRIRLNEGDVIALKRTEKAIQQALCEHNRPMYAPYIGKKYRNFYESTERLHKLGRILSVLEEGRDAAQRKTGERCGFEITALRKFRQHRYFPEKIFTDKDLVFLGASHLDIAAIGAERLPEIIRPFVRKKMDELTIEVRAERLRIQNALMPFRREAKRLAAALGTGPVRKKNDGRGKPMRRQCLCYVQPR